MISSQSESPTETDASIFLAPKWHMLSLVPFKGPKKSRAPWKVSIFCQAHLESWFGRVDFIKPRQIYSTVALIFIMPRFLMLMLSFLFPKHVTRIQILVLWFSKRQSLVSHILDPWFIIIIHGSFENPGTHISGGPVNTAFNPKYANQGGSISAPKILLRLFA